MIGLIRPEVAYVARYGKALPKPTRVWAYNKNIENDATAVVCARSQAAHKSKRADRATYTTARQETTQFVLAVVADNWVRELQDSKYIYTKVSTKDLFANIQTGCTGRHALDLLALHNEIQRYQIEVKGIPGYINMLKDA